MDQQERELLNNTFNLAKENNEILIKMRRGQKRAAIIRAVYWLIIIGISIGAFYFIQPYLTQMEDIIKKAGVDLNTFKSILPKQISG